MIRQLAPNLWEFGTQGPELLEDALHTTPSSQSIPMRGELHPYVLLSQAVLTIL